MVGNETRWFSWSYKVVSAYVCMVKQNNCATLIVNAAVPVNTHNVYNDDEEETEFLYDNTRCARKGTDCWSFPKEAGVQSTSREWDDATKQ